MTVIPFARRRRAEKEWQINKEQDRLNPIMKTNNIPVNRVAESR